MRRALTRCRIVARAYEHAKHPSRPDIRPPRAALETQTDTHYQTSREGPGERSRIMKYVLHPQRTCTASRCPARSGWAVYCP